MSFGILGQTVAPFLTYVARATKACQLFRSIGAKRAKVMLRVSFIIHVQTCSASCNKSGCCKLREYWLLIGWNKAEVTPYTGVAKQVCHGPFKRASCTNFGAKCRATLLAATTFKNLQQPDLLQDRLRSLVVKRSTSLLNSFSSSTAK